MSFQAYIDNIKAKTGKTPEDFLALAETQGLLKPGAKTAQIVAWLKEEFGLGHGHAMAIVSTIQTATTPEVSPAERIAKQFAGGKAGWHATYIDLIERVKQFGQDVGESAGDSYISLLRGTKKFAIIAVSTKRMDVGIKLKGAEVTDRFESAAGWNAMVTHRVRIDAPGVVDDDLIVWLHKAYNAAR